MGPFSGASLRSLPPTPTRVLRRLEVGVGTLELGELCGDREWVRDRDEAAGVHSSPGGELLPLLDIGVVSSSPPGDVIELFGNRPLKEPECMGDSARIPTLLLVPLP